MTTQSPDPFLPLISIAALTVFGCVCVLVSVAWHHSNIIDSELREPIQSENSLTSSPVLDSAAVKATAVGLQPAALSAVSAVSREDDELKSTMPLGYVDRIQTGLRSAEELNIFIQPIDPNAKIVRKHVCFKAQFDAVRSPMTIKELQQLLGEPSSLRNGPGDVIGWSCEDRRTIKVLMEWRINLNSPYKCRVSESAVLNFGFPTPDELQMSQYMGQGRVRFFLIPERKPGEVEAAIKLVGAGHPSGAS
ncbi:MAG: hypothetical protein JWN70_2548 [Planctomycetaceae bacterium]|nr:hypothetical protein [Planctomycetaceae bacterium]